MIFEQKSEVIVIRYAYHFKVQLLTSANDFHHKKTEDLDKIKQRQKAVFAGNSGKTSSFSLSLKSIKNRFIQEYNFC